MKLVKLGLAVVAAAAFLLAVGCAEKAPEPAQPATQVQQPVYHGKLGTMPATEDQVK